MNRLVYPQRAVLADYARAAVGLAFTAGPAIAIGRWTYAHWVLVPLAGLFAVFAFRTWIRARTTIEWDDSRLSISGTGRASLDWSELASLKLAFYATSRDRTGGWMQLTLRGGGTKVRADSGAENFQAFAARCAAAAVAQGLPLDATTRTNFSALGVRLPEDAA